MDNKQAIGHAANTLHGFFAYVFAVLIILHVGLLGNIICSNATIF